MNVLHYSLQRTGMQDYGDKLQLLSVIMAGAYNSSSHRLQPSRSVRPVSWQPCFLALVMLPLVRAASCTKLPSVQR